MVTNGMSVRSSPGSRGSAAALGGLLHLVREVRRHAELLAGSSRPRGEPVAVCVQDPHDLPGPSRHSLTPRDRGLPPAWGDPRADPAPPVRGEDRTAARQPDGPRRAELPRRCTPPGPRCSTRSSRCAQDVRPAKVVEALGLGRTQDRRGGPQRRGCVRRPRRGPTRSTRECSTRRSTWPRPGRRGEAPGDPVAGGHVRALRPRAAVRPDPGLPARGRRELPGIGPVATYWSSHLGRRGAGRGRPWPGGRPALLDVHAVLAARPPDRAARGDPARAARGRGRAQGRLPLQQGDQGPHRPGAARGRGTAASPGAFTTQLRDLGWHVEAGPAGKRGTQLDVVVAELWTTV